MELTGRITKDAVVRNIKDDKKVVSFTVVENNSYKPKNGERVDVPTFYTCSYWVTDKVAQFLIKGSVVQLTGRIGMNVYNDMNGEAKGYLTYHVNTIKIVHKPTNASESPKTVQGGKNKDDLPF